MNLVKRATNGKAVIIESNWWDPMSQDVIDEVFNEVPFPGWAFEHAAVTETSLMMYFKPEIVYFRNNVEVGETEALPCFRYPLYKGDVPETGALASAKSSSAEKGKLIVDSVTRELVKICEKEFH